MGKKNRKRKPDPNRYKTFWRRFWAGMADSVVFLPMILISKAVWSHSNTIPVLILVLFHIAHCFMSHAYTILLHGFFGQTLGKMLFKVKVIDASEEAAITLSQSFRRNSVPMAFMLVSLCTQVPTILRLGSPFDPDVRALGPLHWIIMSFGTLWFWSEFITMLTNRKRRAVHDFIAGSVVIRVPQQTNAR
jgi:uncharacterized RDD family membrane protein YckC